MNAACASAARCRAAPRLASAPRARRGRALARAFPDPPERAPKPDEEPVKLDPWRRPIVQPSKATPGSRLDRVMEAIMPAEEGDAKDWAWMWGSTVVLVWMSASMVQLAIHCQCMLHEASRFN